MTCSGPERPGWERLAALETESGDARLRAYFTLARRASRHRRLKPPSKGAPPITPSLSSRRSYVATRKVAAHRPVSFFFGQRRLNMTMSLIATHCPSGLGMGGAG